MENEKRNIQLDGQHIRIKNRSEILSERASLSDILKKLIKDQQPSKDVHIHVVVDEYNGEDLNREEAEELKKVLNADNMENSNIMIIAQTMEYRRKVNNIEEEKYNYKCTGIREQFTLHNTMRTTTRINDLVIAAQEVISAKPNMYYFDEVITKRDNTDGPNNDHQHIYPNNPEIDEALKHCKHGNTDCTDTILEVNYEYTGDGNIGHSIKGDLPCLYEVPFEHSNNLDALVGILKDCLAERSGMLIVFFD